MQINFYYSATGPWELTGDGCWDQCGNGGKCSICGESGFCCRNEDHPTWNGDCPTEAIQAALNDRHQCVAPIQGFFRNNMHVTYKFYSETLLFKQKFFVFCGRTSA